ncbi:MAG: DUF362 domain-containing protein [Chloroflexi bacterium]|nr:DUF362 domain-containing protein [Chloroflexota bacterium]
MTTKPLPRRAFLRWLGLATGGAALAACAPPTAPPPTAIPTRAAAAGLTATPPAAATPTTAAAPTTASAPTATAAPTFQPTVAPTLPDLVVARGGQPEALVQQALAALGGMEQFVHAGDDVIIKPNICVAYHTYEYAATTNPWVVAALVRLALGAGARRVRVMDAPFGGGPEEAYVRSGIQEQVQAAGGQMEIMSRFKYVSAPIPNGRDIQKWDIYDDILKADVVINVPIAKDHGLARLTLGMKNLMGVVQNRGGLHSNLGQRLADLHSVLRPTLTVVDAVRILADHGPSGGRLEDVRQIDTLVVSRDVVAADSYVASLFGLQPNDLAYIRAAAEMGLGQSDLSRLRTEEIAVGT